MQVKGGLFVNIKEKLCSRKWAAEAHPDNMYDMLLLHQIAEDTGNPIKRYFWGRVFFWVKDMACYMLISWKTYGLVNHILTEDRKKQFMQELDTDTLLVSLQAIRVELERELFGDDEGAEDRKRQFFEGEEWKK
jgi:hypothetical protein